MVVRLPLGSLLLLSLLFAVLAVPGCGGRSAAPPADVGADEVDVTKEAAAAAWDADTPVGRVVAEAPATVRIFELVRIDYCCGGNRPLADAAAEQGLDVDALLGALEAARAPAGDPSEIRWDQRPLPELLDHIVATHHVFLRRELPRLARIVGTDGKSLKDLAAAMSSMVAARYDELAEVLARVDDYRRKPTSRLGPAPSVIGYRTVRLPRLSATSADDGQSVTVKIAGVEVRGILSNLTEWLAGDQVRTIRVLRTSDSVLLSTRDAADAGALVEASLSDREVVDTCAAMLLRAAARESYPLTALDREDFTSLLLGVERLWHFLGEPEEELEAGREKARSDLAHVESLASQASDYR